MLRTDSTTSLVGTAMVNVPSSFTVAPTVVPWTDTCPEVMISLVNESSTLPVTTRVCADAWVTIPRNSNTSADRIDRHLMRRILLLRGRTFLFGLPAIARDRDRETM